MIYQKIICVNCAFYITELINCPIVIDNQDKYFEMGSTLFGINLLPKREIFDWIIERNGHVILDSNQRVGEGSGELIISTFVELSEKAELEFKLKFDSYKEVIIQ
jgi:hypothetical protein